MRPALSLIVSLVLLPIPNTVAGARSLSNLTEKLAYEQLSSGVRAGRGVVLAGGTHKIAFREAAAYAERYGGQASDWVKKSTTHSVSTAGGNVHQIHWVENLRTGELMDVKLKTVARSP